MRPYSLAVLVLSTLFGNPVTAAFGQVPPPKPTETASLEAAAVSKAAATPAAPYYVSFQGYLEDDGSPADGTYSIEFRFMNLATLGSALWTETHPSVQVTDGVYNVLLGSISTLATEDFNDHIWLSIKVNGGNEILPRARIVGTPYSFLAFEALDVRLPAAIAGSTQVQGDELLKISQHPGAAGDVLEIDGGGAASTGISVHGVDLTGVSASAEFGSAFSASGGKFGFSAGGQTEDAFTATSPTDDAFVVNSAGNDGLHIETVTDDGINILDAGDDAIYIANAGDDAIFIENATDDGIFVDGVGGHAFKFRDVPTTSTGNVLSAYVGVIENTSTGTSADALAIQIETPGNPGTAANLIGFFDGDNDLIGQIEGNGSGGVAYNTTGSDYAEYLPHRIASEEFEAGDIVGVFNGRISHETDGADQVMAITDQAAVLGNMPGGADVAAGYESVSFIGQVPVKIRGPIDGGDYVVASGQNDGVGIGVSPENITLDHVSKLVGQAWGSSVDSGVSRVNVVVGLDRTEILEAVIRRQERQLETQQKALNEIQRLLELHVRQHSGS